MATEGHIIKDGKFSINGVVNETYIQLTGKGQWGTWLFMLNGRNWAEWIAPEAVEFFSISRPEYLVVGGIDLSALSFYKIAEKLGEICS